VHKLKFIVAFLFLIVAHFPYAQGAELNRDYGKIHYCGEHAHSRQLSALVENRLHLIPAIAGQCCHVECPRCHHARATFCPYSPGEPDETGDFFHPLCWCCDCKAALMQSDETIPNNTWMSWWIRCYKQSIYPGYLSKNYTKYFSFFAQFLEHVDNHRYCTCYWPETSPPAAQINNRAFNLFRSLFKDTDLKEVIGNAEEQKQLLQSSSTVYHSADSLALNSICHCFFFSDYDWVCKDIEYFSRLHYEGEALAKIRGKLDQIRESLATLYLPLYSECFYNHRTARVDTERCLVQSQLNLPLIDSYMTSHTTHYIINLNDRAISHPVEEFEIEKDENWCQAHEEMEEEEAISFPSPPAERLAADIHQARSTFYNDLGLYQQAIENAMLAIESNPANREAYIERAIAYFETNQMESALEDYEKAQTMALVPPFTYESDSPVIQERRKKTDQAIVDQIDFASGLASGVLKAANDQDELASLNALNSPSGLSTGLWAHVCSPRNISEEMVHAAYAMGHFLNRSTRDEGWRAVLPEIVELSYTWEDLNDRQKGEKIGFLIGRYGVDIFMPDGIKRGMSRGRALKRANAMLTLECCLDSPNNQGIISEKSAIHQQLRNRYLTLAEDAPLIKNENLKYFVMQPQHGWNQIFLLSGNIEEDFSKALRLIAEYQVTSERYLRKSIPLAEGLWRHEYKKKINNHTVRVIIDEYTSSGSRFLIDARVMSRR
jgi:tetratricopeptide (TPR) repeat protein